jgi:CheY-like chemotaxis protein
VVTVRTKSGHPDELRDLRRSAIRQSSPPLRCHKPILIVDDDDDVREMASLHLQRSGGHLVECVTNGREALDYLYSDGCLPCVILLDMMMPVMDGWEVLTILKSQDALASIPIVVVTCVPGDSRLKTLHQGPVIGKPMQLSLLVRAVNDLCRAETRASQR